MESNKSNRRNLYASLMRSTVILIVLVFLLVLSPQIPILINQKFVISEKYVTGVEIVRILITLVITAVLLNLAYVLETQFPKLANYKNAGNLFASTIHIIVIFLSYYYLSPFTMSETGEVNQFFNAAFLILLCVPLYRGGVSLYKTIDDVAKRTTESIENLPIKCSCGQINEAGAKYCASCGKLLRQIEEVPAIICDSCGKQNSLSTKFCSNCGAKLINKEQVATICPQCETPNKLSAKHCKECGTELVPS